MTANITTSYYYLGGTLVAMSENGTLTYLHQDLLGGTSVMTDASGAWLGTIKYTPFGETRSITGTIATDKKFTGQELDDTGLYYYNTHYYDPTIGRFISPDTIIPHPSNPQSFNRYSYCLNNPLKYTDPSGNYDDLTEAQNNLEQAYQSGDPEAIAYWQNQVREIQGLPLEDPNKTVVQVVVTESGTKVTTANGNTTVYNNYSEPQKLEPGLKWDAVKKAAIPMVAIIGGTSSTGVGIAIDPIEVAGFIIICGVVFAIDNRGWIIDKASNVLNTMLSSSNQDKKLTNGEIERLKRGGVDPHDLKEGSPGQKDLYKDKNGNIIVKPKGGNGPGEPTGLNINNY